MPPIERRDPRGNFRFFENRQKYLLFVHTCSEKRVIADPHHTGMLRALEKWGFEPITTPFLHYAAFGGAFPLIELGRIDLILIADLADREVRAAPFFQNLPLGIGGQLPPRSRFVVAFHTAAPCSWIFYSHSDENVPVSFEQPEYHLIYGQFSLNSIWAIQA